MFRKKHSENVVEIIFSFWTWMEPDWLRGMHNWRALAIFHSWQWGKCLKWWGWESILRTEHILTELLFISFKKLLFLNVYLCWSKLSERITRFAFKWWHNPTFASNCFSLLVYLFLFLPVFFFSFQFSTCPKCPPLKKWSGKSQNICVTKHINYIPTHQHSTLPFFWCQEISWNCLFFMVRPIRYY